MPILQMKEGEDVRHARWHSESVMGHVQIPVSSKNPFNAVLSQSWGPLTRECPFLEGSFGGSFLMPVHGTLCLLSPAPGVRA